MDTSTPSGAASIRSATPDDADVLAELFWRVRSESVPEIQMIAHDRSTVERFVREVMLQELEVWLAERDGSAVGFLALMRPDVLGHLYIAAPHTNQGLGGRLLALAKQQLPGGLQLWAFQSNSRALRFYERHGLVPVEWTDGDNEEGEPDVRMVWRP
jgi:GNAT superfamily N-acetyltransferase